MNGTIRVCDIEKYYGTKDNITKAVNRISFEVRSGEFVGVMGASGSGKTTLLQILGTILEATSGEIKINGEPVDNMNDEQKSHLRRDQIGFVFQDFMLNPYLKAYENVMLPMLIKKDLKLPQMKSKAIDILDNLGLAARADHFPHQLSGGEQQRVAIARALANEPDIILADEPTGNLDEDNEAAVFSLLKNIAADNRCVITVSHNDSIKNYADMILSLVNGRLMESSGDHYEK